MRGDNATQSMAATSCTTGHDWMLPKAPSPSPACHCRGAHPSPKSGPAWQHQPKSSANGVLMLRCSTMAAGQGAHLEVCSLQTC